MAVSVDMGKGYAKSVSRARPQAVICIGNHHVVQFAAKALDEVRHEHWNESRRPGEQDAAKQFKDARWSLLKKNPQDVTERQANTLAALHAVGGKIPRAWAMKGMVCAIFAAGLTEHTVAELIDRLLARLSTGLKPFVRLGRTIRNTATGSSPPDGSSSATPERKRSTRRSS